VHVQAPPNLAFDQFPRLLDAGIDDWGGVSPVTIDHVNPEAPWPEAQRLSDVTRAHGFELAPRLCAYPRYLNSEWIDAAVLPHVLRVADSLGLAREDPWAPGDPVRVPTLVRDALPLDTSDELDEDAIETVRIGVVEKVNVHRIARRSQRIGDELRPKGGTTDSDQQDVLKSLSVFRRDLSSVHIRCKLFDARISFFDVRAQFRIWSKSRIAQPVMADHALLIGIGDGARFQFFHGGKRLVDLGPHSVEKIIRKFHPADVDGKIGLVVAEKILLEALPE
jgi:hypothetical protein